MKFVLRAIVLALLWGMVGYTIFYIDPASIANLVVEGLYLPFLGLVFVATLYSLSLLFRSLGKALFISVLIILLLTTGILGYFNWFLGLVVLLIIVIVLFGNRR